MPLRNSFALFVLFLSTPLALAQPEPTIDEAFLEAMEYRSIGPYRGGRVTAVAGVNDSLHTFYMGSTGGGVWRTDDAGQNWRNLTDGQIDAGSIGSIAVAPLIPTSFTSGLAPPVRAATCPPASACTAPPTRERHGNT